MVIHTHHCWLGQHVLSACPLCMFYVFKHNARFEAALPRAATRLGQHVLSACPLCMFYVFKHNARFERTACPFSMSFQHVLSACPFKIDFMAPPLFNIALSISLSVMTRYIKLTNSSNTHNGFTFIDGLNVDTVPFTNGECEPGGIYYTTIDHFGEWLDYSDSPMYYVWDVEIPNDAQTIHFKTKSKSDKIILSNMRSLDYFVNSLTKKEKIVMVKQNRYALEIIKEQTEPICLAAVKKNGKALQFVKEQTEPICLAAVKQNGLALEFIKEQTEQICIDAIKQDWSAIQFVKEQTPKICMVAVNEYGWALKFVKEQTPEICLTAVKHHGWALEFVKKKDKSALFGCSSAGWESPAICQEANRSDLYGCG